MTTGRVDDRPFLSLLGLHMCTVYVHISSTRQCVLRGHSHQTYIDPVCKSTSRQHLRHLSVFRLVITHATWCIVLVYIIIFGSETAHVGLLPHDDHSGHRLTLMIKQAKSELLLSFVPCSQSKTFGLQQGVHSLMCDILPYKHDSIFLRAVHSYVTYFAHT